MSTDLLIIIGLLVLALLLIAASIWGSSSKKRKSSPKYRIKLKGRKNGAVWYGIFSYTDKYSLNEFLDSLDMLDNFECTIKVNSKVYRLIRAKREIDP